MTPRSASEPRISTDTTDPSTPQPREIIVQHQRVSDPANSGAFGSTFADSFTPPITGTYTDPAGYEQYTVGAGGAARVGLGVWPYIGIDVRRCRRRNSLRRAGGAPYIDPTGIVNAASYSPFTAGISGGEFLTLYGSNLAPGTTVFSGATFPTILNGVQVLVNGIAAPLYYVDERAIGVRCAFRDGSVTRGVDTGHQQWRSLQCGNHAGEFNHPGSIHPRQQRAWIRSRGTCRWIARDTGQPRATR